MQIPTLDPAPSSLPWIGSTFSAEFGNLPSSCVPFMAIGLSQTQVPIPPLPGCTQLSTAEAVETLTLNGNTATWSIAIPADPALVDVSLFLQGAALLAGGNNALGAVLSSGGQATIGMR